MIRKFLVISEGGLLPFYLSKDLVGLDKHLLSGFCSAIYSISQELTYPLKTIGFERNKMIIEKIKHQEIQDLLMAMLFDEYHIEEGIINKIRYIYSKFFESREFKDVSEAINSKKLNRRISDVMEDISLKNFISNNILIIRSILDPIIQDEKNSIYAYSLNSSMNNILYCNGIKEMVKYYPGVDLKGIIIDYLYLLKMETIPQGDKFIGMDLPNGLDVKDYYNTGQKTLGIVINTSINMSDEPNNELLLYFFGKNMIMRSYIPVIEVKLRNALLNK